MKNKNLNNIKENNKLINEDNINQNDFDSIDQNLKSFKQELEAEQIKSRDRAVLWKLEKDVNDWVKKIIRTIRFNKISRF